MKHEGKGAEGYKPLLNNSLTNELSRVNKNDIDAAQVDYNGSALIVRGGLQMMVPNAHAQPFLMRPSAQRAFDFFMMLYTERRNGQMSVPISEYREICGQKDYKTAKIQLGDDLQALSRLQVQHRDVTSDNHIFMNLISSGGVVGNKAFLNLTPEFCEVLEKRQYQMPLPLEYFRVNLNQNPNTQPLWRKILENKRINAGNPKRADVITVATLLAVCPTVRPYEEAKGRVQQTIIDPFERDLNAINERYCINNPIFTWHYLEADGSPVLDVEIITNYETFISRKIEITWLRYPDQTTLIQARRKTARARNSKRKKGARCL